MSNCQGQTEENQLLIGYAGSRSFRLTFLVRIGEHEKETIVEVNEPTSEELLCLFDKTIGMITPQSAEKEV